MEVKLPMSEKPLHFDGSVQQAESTNNDSVANEPFTLTDEMRMNISGNPYTIENN